MQNTPIKYTFIVYDIDVSHTPPLIPYFATSRYKIDTMIELANIQSNEKVADLGSGDGRITIGFAYAGAHVEGFETDEELSEHATKEIKRLGLDENAIIHTKNFWEENLSRFDIICIYPMPDIMESLKEKLKKELRSKARILTNYYAFADWKETAKKDNIYLYIV